MKHKDPFLRLTSTSTQSEYCDNTVAIQISLKSMQSLQNRFVTLSGVTLFVTARIRSMTGRYCFHRCLSVNISGGGGVPGLSKGKNF